MHLDWKQRRALEQVDINGHALEEFNRNGDIWIARCARCKGAAIIHEDGHISGTTLDFECTENNGPRRQSR